MADGNMGCGNREFAVLSPPSATGNPRQHHTSALVLRRPVTRSPVFHWPRFLRISTRSNRFNTLRLAPEVLAARRLRCCDIKLKVLHPSCAGSDCFFTMGAVKSKAISSGLGASPRLAHQGDALGGTGDSPVPVGDSPTGTCDDIPFPTEPASHQPAVRPA